MTEQTKDTKDDIIRVQASNWIAKIDGDNLTQEDLSDFIEWVRRSPRHEEELKHQAVIWDTLDEILNVKAATSNKEKQSRTFSFWPMPALTAIAATVIVLFVIGISSFTPLDDTDSPLISAGIYSTQIGEKRNITLSDGSIITLNTDGEVEVDIQPDSRNIRLIKGEAFFKVAHDKSRPFQVTVGSAVIKALGTTFDVHMRDNKIVVLVEEGHVQLSSLLTSLIETELTQKNSKEPMTIAIISAGQSVTFDPVEDEVEKNNNADIIKKLAWRNDMLVFDGDSLEFVLQDVSRYTKQNFIITEPELRKLRISGYFPTGKTKALLATLEQSFDIIVTKIDDEYIYISRKK
ncbi:MAG: hypothetical protein COB49_04685 [Alphaproteobacteria bacterium]|nr:MAG: hypothetical protein COB49_04685 [Alphaproteobacteria bacterium]